MSDNRPVFGTTEISGRVVRTALIEGTDYVAMEDFCTFLQSLAGKIAELTTRQQNQTAALTMALELVCAAVAEQDPDAREALEAAARGPSRLV